MVGFQLPTSLPQHRCDSQPTTSPSTREGFELPFFIVDMTSLELPLLLQGFLYLDLVTWPFLGGENVG